jgi:hypothetical protein
LKFVDKYLLTRNSNMKLSHFLSEANLPDVIKPKAPLATRSVQSLGKVATADDTRKRAANVELPDQAMGRLRDFFANVSDDEVPEPETPPTAVSTVTADSIPATLQSAMVDAGNAHPEWHMIQNLPGYISGPIRKMGKAVFAQYTETPVENIQMIANLGGQGPNTSKEINAVANWIVKNGEPVSTGNIEFNMMPGYSADVKVFDIDDVEVMVVKDDHGQYIYAWPAADSKL